MAKAKFRMVHTSFWNDPTVSEEMTPEDKYFFLYLLTNEHTTQIGIYGISKKQMAFEMGYSPESINALVERFTNHHNLIRYNVETREIAIKNWGKYNFNKGGKPVLDCVRSELKSVKDIELIPYVSSGVENEAIKKIYDSYYDTCQESLDDTSTNRQNDEPKESQINTGAPSHDTSTIRTTTRGQEKEKEKEKEEEEKEQQQEVASPAVEEVDIRKIDPFNFYQQNGFGVLSSIIHFKILNWIKDLSDELVVYAMQLAIESNKVSWSYVEGILKNWANKNIQTVEQAEALRAQFEAQKQQQHNTPYKRGRQEVVPEWFEKHKQEVLTPSPSTTAPVFDFEAERQKMLDKLNA